MHELSSNPALSAEESTLEAIKSGFLFDKKQVRHPPMPPNAKFKTATLVHYDYDLSKRWYVTFWAWDVSKEKKVRRRLYEPLNRMKSVASRVREADSMIRAINSQLYQGKVLGKDKVVSNGANLLKLTLTEAIQYVFEQKNLNKNRPTYTRSYSNLKRKIIKWLEEEHRPDPLLKTFDIDDAYSLFEFIRSSVGSNATVNNYRDDLSVAFNFLMKRNPNLFKTNPMSFIQKLPTVAKRHAAYSDAQIDAIKNECIKHGHTQTLLFIQFIYYTLARPIELRQLKVGHIDIVQRRILFPAELSKNRRDEYVGISPQLYDVIIESGILQHPSHYFIFAMKQPGEKPVSKLYFYRRLVKILKLLGYDKLPTSHDLYSFKHSGAISLYKATKDIKLVQEMCRHTSVSQTDHYLRDLGLIGDFDRLDKWKGNL